MPTGKRLISDLLEDITMSNELFSLMRPEILAMNAYSSARSEQNENQLQINKIWLDANENPWDSVLNKKYNRYPEPQPCSLIALLASLYKVNLEQILITRGSDEGIDLLVR